MAKKTIITLIIVLFLFHGQVIAAGASNETPGEQEKEEKAEQTEQTGQKEKSTPNYEDEYRKDPFLKGFLSDLGHIYSYPFRLKGKDLINLGALSLVTGVLIANDEEIYREIKTFQSKHKIVDKVSPHLSVMCQGFSFGVATFFLVEGLLFKDKKGLETGSLAWQAMFHSFLVVQTVKHLTGRTRPSEFDGQDRWIGPRGFFERYKEDQWAKHDAFFSGHTITIWSLATVIAHQYRNKFWVGALSYTLATLGGLATVTEDLHWLSDILPAAIAGYAIGRLVVKRRSKSYRQSIFSKLNIMPVLGKKTYGLNVSYVF